MSAPEHSPLPWRIPEGCGTILDANGHVVYIDAADAEEIANARLIVTAVNTRAELLAAAKRSLRVLQKMQPHVYMDVAEALEAAITRAEESAS
jgi:hypothetical protein